MFKDLGNQNLENEKENWGPEQMQEPPASVPEGVRAEKELPAFDEAYFEQLGARIAAAYAPVGGQSSFEPIRDVDVVADRFEKTSAGSRMPEFGHEIIGKVLQEPMLPKDVQEEYDKMQRTAKLEERQLPSVPGSGNGFQGGFSFDV